MQAEAEKQNEPNRFLSRAPYQNDDGDNEDDDKRSMQQQPGAFELALDNMSNHRWTQQQSADRPTRRSVVSAVDSIDDVYDITWSG